jgi:hypothetical protein
MKKCGFCSFTGEEPAFTQHMREAHAWGASPAVAPAPRSSASNSATNIALAILALVVVIAIGAATTPRSPSGATSAMTATATARAATLSPSPTPTPQPRVGDTIARGNWEYTVTAVDRAPSFTWSSFGNVETAKGVWVFVRLTLKNLGDRNFGIGPQDFVLQDSAGIRYDPCGSFACFSYLSHNKLALLSSLEQFPPGVETKTALLFDLNPSAAGLRLVLKQGRDSTIALD